MDFRRARELTRPPPQGEYARGMTFRVLEVVSGLDHTRMLVLCVRGACGGTSLSFSPSSRRCVAGERWRGALVIFPAGLNNDPPPRSLAPDRCRDDPSAFLIGVRHVRISDLSAAFQVAVDVQSRRRLPKVRRCRSIDLLSPKLRLGRRHDAQGLSRSSVGEVGARCARQPSMLVCQNAGSNVRR